MPTWIFLRHGESVANAEDWLSGHLDAPLTDRGRAQADAAGRALADQDLARVVSSDLSRARETAQRLVAAWARARGCPPLPVQELAALEERHTGDWGGRNREELRKAGLLVRLTTWDQGPPGGETQQQIAARVLPAMTALEAQAVAGPTLVVAHGGVLRIIVGLIDGTPHDQLGFFGVPNAEPLIRQVSAGFFSKVLLSQAMDLKR